MITFMRLTTSIFTLHPEAAFDCHALQWGSWTKDGSSNGPGGYNSIQHILYSIKITHFYKIMFNHTIAGGISIFTSGNKHAVVDKLFIAPEFQNKNIGTQTMYLIEREFPRVYRWELGTSAKSKANHHFYEKIGYRKTFQDENYIYFEKKKASLSDPSVTLFSNSDLSRAEFEDCSLTGAEFFSVNMEKATISNTNMSHMTLHDINLSQTTLHNINMSGANFGDMNLNHIELCQASLGGAYIHDTNLGWHESHGPITFERCDLTESTLSNCVLRGVNIQDCDITDMKINGISVEELLRIYQEKI